MCAVMNWAERDLRQIIHLAQQGVTCEIIYNRGFSNCKACLYRGAGGNGRQRVRREEKYCMRRNGKGAGWELSYSSYCPCSTLTNTTNSSSVVYLNQI